MINICRNNKTRRFNLTQSNWPNWWIYICRVKEYPRGTVIHPCLFSKTSLICTIVTLQIVKGPLVIINTRAYFIWHIVSLLVSIHHFHFKYSFFQHCITLCIVSARLATLRSKQWNACYLMQRNLKSYALRL